MGIWKQAVRIQVLAASSWYIEVLVASSGYLEVQEVMLQCVSRGT